jgi:hypothetical protein
VNHELSNFSQKTYLNFFKNKNINQELTFNMHAKAQKTISEWFWGGGCMGVYVLFVKGHSTAF